jgi:hypothetical protein
MVSNESIAHIGAGLVLLWIFFLLVGFLGEFGGVLAACMTAPLAVSHCKVETGSDPKCDKIVGARELEVTAWSWFPVGVITVTHSVDWYCDVPIGQLRIGNMLSVFLGDISRMFIGILVIAVLGWKFPFRLKSKNLRAPPKK